MNSFYNVYNILLLPAIDCIDSVTIYVPAQLYHDVIICCMLHRSAEPSHQPAVTNPVWSIPMLYHQSIVVSHQLLLKIR